MRPYILKETNWKAIQETKFEVAVLPWGATEAHNYHLPYGTDIIEAEEVAAEGARLAWEQGVKVIVLPCIPFGVNTGQFDVTLDINMNPSTQLAVLHDVVMFLCVCTWFNAVDQKRFFENKDDHAGEMETSVIMHLHPDLVRPLSEAGDGKAKKFVFNAMQEGWAWAERRWTSVTKDTGVGDPSKASAEKGKRFFEAVTQKVSTFFIQVAITDKDKFYS